MKKSWSLFSSNHCLPRLGDGGLQPAKSLGVLGGDFSGAGRNALYITNDMLANDYFVASGAQPETDAQPETKGDGLLNNRFEEIAIEAGVAVDDQGNANASMGVAALDFNLDQQFDIFVTNFEHEKMALYLQINSNLFRHASRQAGLSRPELKLVGFGVVAADFDSDVDEGNAAGCSRRSYQLAIDWHPLQPRCDWRGSSLRQTDGNEQWWW